MEIKGKKPDFNQLLKVLNGEVPDRPVLFEFFLNDELYSHLAGEDIETAATNIDKIRIVIKAFITAGYDYATVPAWFTDTLQFSTDEFTSKESRSANEGSMITDRDSFENYPWPNPEDGDYDIYNQLEEFVPDGAKLIACGPSGVLEIVTDLVGYETLCIMSLMDDELTQDIFDAVGSRLLKYYEILAKYNSVGALIVNDDWGFKTQTMLDTPSMQRYIIPWHKKIVAAIHKQNKPAIMHSCGNLKEVMDTIIDDIKFDAKHSYEDGIIPVEEAYEKWGDRVAIMGGIDMDFLARKSPEEINERAKNLLRISSKKGRYALGSGNSIPNYIPNENYFAMISAVNEFDL